MLLVVAVAVVGSVVVVMVTDRVLKMMVTMPLYPRWWKQWWKVSGSQGIRREKG